VAAALLVVAAIIAGGVVGWTAAVFFAVVVIVLAVRLVRLPVVARLGPDGVGVRPPRGELRTVAWDDVQALLLWTGLSSSAAGAVDRLGVVTLTDLDALGVVSPWVQPQPSGHVDPDRAVAVSTALVDCELDAGDLRAAVAASGARAVVVDRRR
jgi:hypothetical protein